MDSLPSKERLSLDEFWSQLPMSPAKFLEISTALAMILTALTVVDPLCQATSMVAMRTDLMTPATSLEVVLGVDPTELMSWRLPVTFVLDAKAKATETFQSSTKRIYETEVSKSCEVFTLKPLSIRRGWQRSIRNFGLWTGGGSGYPRTPSPKTFRIFAHARPGNCTFRHKP